MPLSRQMHTGCRQSFIDSLISPSDRRIATAIDTLSNKLDIVTGFLSEGDRWPLQPRHGSMLSTGDQVRFLVMQRSGSVVVQISARSGLRLWGQSDCTHAPATWRVKVEIDLSRGHSSGQLPSGRGCNISIHSPSKLPIGRLRNGSIQPLDFTVLTHGSWASSGGCPGSDPNTRQRPIP